MTGARRAGGPRLGPRVAQPQGAPPPLAPYLGTDRAAAGVREVDLAQLAPDPDQPRRHFDPVRLAQLAASIRAHGLLQPLVVRQEGLGTEGDMRYTVIAGGRRLAAIRQLVDGPDAVDDPAERDRLRRVAVVLHGGDAATRRVLQLVENIQRESLTPVEEAHALREIMRVDNLSTATLAGRIGRSQGYVDERLRLLRHEAVEAAVEAGTLTASAGAAVASLHDDDARATWLTRAGDGERVAAAAVYASKKPVRSRPAPAPPSGGVPPDAANVPPPTPSATTDALASDAATLETLRAMRLTLARLPPPADIGWRRAYATALAALLDTVGDALNRLYR